MAAHGLIFIGDPGDPRLAIFRDQRDQWRRARHRAWMEGLEAEPASTATGLDPALDPAGDLFMAEGATVVAQLLASPHGVACGMIADARLDHHRHLADAIAERAPLYVVPRAAAEAIAGFDVHRGLLAVGRRRDPGPAESVLAGSACCVLLEDLANHDNVGGIFRSVRALAPPSASHAHRACVLLSPRCCDPFYRKALRVSMGNALHVPFATLRPWPAALAQVAEAGFTLLAMHPDAGAEDIRGVSAPRPALVMGTEGPGLSRECLGIVRSLGGRVVRIPIDPAADSLNVGVAAAIALERLLPRG